VPVCMGMQPHLHHCGCGCMGFSEVEEEVRMLENYKRRLQDELEAVGKRLEKLKKIKES